MPESSIMNALMDVIADRKNNPPGGAFLRRKVAARGG